MYKSVYLKKGKEESLKRFHPWIFSGAIQAMDEGIEEGDIVRVFTRSGEFIAIGHYQIGSIAVRVLSFRDIEIDEEYWCARLDSAYKMRLALGIAGNSSNTTYRLVHGEGDNLPGLVIDCYGSYCCHAGSQCGYACLPHGDSQSLEEGDGRSTGEYLL